MAGEIELLFNFHQNQLVDTNRHQLTLLTSQALIHPYGQIELKLAPLSARDENKIHLYYLGLLIIETIFNP